MSRDDDYLDSHEYRDQRERERLCIACVQAMTSGYEVLSVALVSELCGCSPETFYRYYGSLADCICDACSHTLQESRSATVSGWLTVHGWSERLRSSCVALLRHVEEHPEAAQAVLVTALCGGPEVADHLREVIAFHERTLVMSFQLHPEGFPTSRLTPRALTGGMRHVLYRRIREGRQGEIAALAGDLHEWIECHRSAIAAGLPIAPMGSARTSAAAATARSSMREGQTRPACPAPMFAGEGERSRVLETVAQLMLQQGREELDDRTVARFAGISAARFVADHGGLNACVSEIVDRLVEGNGAALAAGVARGEDWPQSVRAAVLQSMRHLSANCDLARLALLRLSLVPEVAESRHAALAEQIVAVALERAPTTRHAQGLLPHALIGAVNDLLIWALAGDASARLPALANHIAFFLLAPCVGGERAAEAVVASIDAECFGEDPRRSR